MKEYFNTRISICALFVAIAQTALAFAPWYDSQPPHFQPSIPSTANGAVVYEYTYSGRATGQASAGVVGTLDVYTEEFGSVGGQTTVERGSATHTLHSTYQCQTQENEYLTATMPSQEYDDIKNNSSFPGSTTTTDLNGTGYSGFVIRGESSFFYQDNGTCGTVQGVGGNSSYYYLYIELDQGATPPNLPSFPASAYSEGTEKPIVSIDWLNDAKEANPHTVGGVRISRTGSTSGALTVYFSIGGTATGPSPSGDYYLDPSSSTSITIASGSASVDIDVIPNSDFVADNNETVEFTLSSSSEYAIGSPSSATVYISD